MIPPDSPRNRDPGQVVGAREFACDLLRLIDSFDSLRRQRDVHRAVADGVSSVIQLLPDSGLESLIHLVASLRTSASTHVATGTGRPPRETHHNN